jgi:hypothetical protein
VIDGGGGLINADGPVRLVEVVVVVDVCVAVQNAPAGRFCHCIKQFIIVILFVIVTIPSKGSGGYCKRKC